MGSVRSIGLISVIFLASCAGGPQKSPPADEPVWPAPPAPARVRFLKAFSGPTELGIGSGFFARMGDLFTGREKPRLVRPMAVAATPERVLFVADPGAKGIHRFDRAQKRYRLVRGTRGQPLPSPVGLAVGPDGSIYCVDSALAQVLVIPREAREAAVLPVQQELVRPVGIAVSPDGQRLYVVDSGAHQVRVFGPEGTARFTIGERGTGPGQFNFPTAAWIDEAGRLFVSDTLNFRVQIFEGDGAYVASFGSLGDATGDFARPKGLATDRLGRVYVVESLFHMIQVFDDSGRFLLAFGGLGHGPGEFWLPVGIFVSEDDILYVTDGYNRRVQVFELLGGQ